LDRRLTTSGQGNKRPITGLHKRSSKKGGLENQGHHLLGGGRKELRGSRREKLNGRVESSNPQRKGRGERTI